ncbi:hypothetical protein G7054_g14943 [Neopestalotiopsis clavispora]|nr:hypothetical protein G7054_g14943 [Neopestalotiopsis clavispora]
MEATFLLSQAIIKRFRDVAQRILSDEYRKDRRTQSPADAYRNRSLSSASDRSASGFDYHPHPPPLAPNQRLLSFAAPTYNKPYQPATQPRPYHDYDFPSDYSYFITLAIRHLPRAPLNSRLRNFLLSQTITWESRDQHVAAKFHEMPDFECDTCHRYYGSQHAVDQYMDALDK